MRTERWKAVPGFPQYAVSDYGRVLSWAKGKLTESQVHEARRRIAAGESGASIGRDFGVHEDTIGKIKRGVTWGHLQEEDDGQV
jgi:hypothetical protein